MKGKYTPKTKFESFITAKQNVRLHTETAFIDAEQLSGVLENIKFKMTIHDDGSIDFDEVDTNQCDDAMKQRLLDELCEKKISPFAKKMVISSLRFKTEDDKPVYLSVQTEIEKPIDKLKNMLTETPKASSKAKSFLQSLFDSEDIEQEESNDESEETQTETAEDAQTQQVPLHVQMMQDALEETKRHKQRELEERLEKELESLKKSRFQKDTAEKNILKLEEEIRILNTRLDSMTPKKEENGVVFYVSVEQKNDIQDDEKTREVVNKLAPVMNLNVDAVMNLLTEGFYDIKLAPKDDLESKDIDRNLLTDIVEQLDPLGKYEIVESNHIRYRGELKWHKLVDKMIKLGFEQNAEFDELSGSVSYKSEFDQQDEQDDDIEMREEAREEFEEMMGYECGDEFIFAMTDDPSQMSPSNTIMAIQPKSYWDNEGCQYDQHSEYLMNLKGFDEEMESTFTNSQLTSAVDIIRELVKQGVKFDPNFQDFMDDSFQVGGQSIEQYMRTNYPDSIV